MKYTEGEMKLAYHFGKTQEEAEFDKLINNTRVQILRIEREYYSRIAKIKWYNFGQLIEANDWRQIELNKIEKDGMV